MLEPKEASNTAREALALWVGVLLPPIAWAAQMEINYALVRRACLIQRSAALYLVTGVALLLVLVAAFVSLSKWKESGAGWPSESSDPRTRLRFLSVLGLLSSGLFFLAIAAQGIATIIFHPCQT
ncbi:MAG: hypothetical protein QOE77_1677 [Blastocatellia bacterium]|jgi:hypothetical protein|nr:hypothetical protein [Blastocatellia bacterium]